MSVSARLDLVYILRPRPVSLQPTGLLVEPCCFATYTGYADIYKADIPFSDMGSSLPVRPSLLCVFNVLMLHRS